MSDMPEEMWAWALNDGIWSSRENYLNNGAKYVLDKSPWVDVRDAPVGVEVLIAYVWDATKYYRVARINTLGYWEGYSEEIGDFTTFEGGGDVIEYMPIPSSILTTTREL